MPELSSEVKNGHVRHIVNLKNGEMVILCRCQHSKEYPLCDGTHKTMDTPIGPAIVQSEHPFENN
jgi:CDGSH-type Zn-finger protein